MDTKQIADLAQFRRYAESAFIALIHKRRPFETDQQIATKAFDIAEAMMLAEQPAFEQCQIKSLEAIIINERERHAQGS